MIDKMKRYYLIALALILETGGAITMCYIPKNPMALWCGLCELIIGGCLAIAGVLEILKHNKDKGEKK